MQPSRGAWRRFARGLLDDDADARREGERDGQGEVEHFVSRSLWRSAPSQSLEHVSGQQQKIADTQRREAVTADERNFDTRIDSERRQNGKDDREEENRKRWRAEIHDRSPGEGAA